MKPQSQHLLLTPLSCDCIWDLAIQTWHANAAQSRVVSQARRAILARATAAAFVAWRTYTSRIATARTYLSVVQRSRTLRYAVRLCRWQHQSLRNTLTVIYLTAYTKAQNYDDYH